MNYIAELKSKVSDLDQDPEPDPNSKVFWIWIRIRIWIRIQGLKNRVGHHVLSRSERSVLSRSFKESSILSRSFFEFLATFRDPKERNVLFFCKERERTQTLFRSFIKNKKEGENIEKFK